MMNCLLVIVKLWEEFIILFLLRFVLEFFSSFSFTFLFDLLEMMLRAFMESLHNNKRHGNRKAMKSLLKRRNLPIIESDSIFFVKNHEKFFLDFSLAS